VKLKLMQIVRETCCIGAAALSPLMAGASAQTDSVPVQPPVATYADIADLADSSSVVLRAEVRKMVRVEPERAPGVRAGWGRYYIEARTRAMLTGASPQGESLRYLVDMPLDSKGKPPSLKKKQVILFGAAVPGHPSDLRLSAPDAQLAWDPQLEGRVRSVLTEFLAPDSPPRITGVREAIHVPGTLAGEGETQIFLSTANESAAAITVRHSPGAPDSWGVSFSEVAGDGTPPAPASLAWYRLACFLPNALPKRANLSDTPINRARADADYRMVLGSLGRCERLRN